MWTRALSPSLSVVNSTSSTPFGGANTASCYLDKDTEHSYVASKICSIPACRSSARSREAWRLASRTAASTATANSHPGGPVPGPATALATVCHRGQYCCRDTSIQLVEEVHPARLASRLCIGEARPYRACTCVLADGLAAGLAPTGFDTWSGTLLSPWLIEGEGLQARHLNGLHCTGSSSLCER